jgi:UDP-glucose:(glucosyl)LPS alpha-1,2-glucosyltransferase
MRGSTSIAERKYILENASFIFCVSNFIKERFLKDINIKTKKIIVLYNGVDRIVSKKSTKNKNVLFVGRLVPKKGIFLFIEAISRISNNYKNWNFTVIGSFPKKNHFKIIFIRKNLKKYLI